MKTLSVFVALALGGPLTPWASAQQDPTAFTGARILPIVGDEIDDGVLVVQNGRIVAVGPSDEVPLPGGARVIVLQELFESAIQWGGWSLWDGLADSIDCL